MKCEKCRSWMDPYLDGALTKRQQRALNDHLSNCPACREALAGRKALVTALGTLAPAEPPIGLNTRLHAALDESLRSQEMTAMGKKLNLGVVSAVTAGLMVLLVAGTLVLGSPSDDIQYDAAENGATGEMAGESQDLALPETALTEDSAYGTAGLDITSDTNYDNTQRGTWTATDKAAEEMTGTSAEESEDQAADTEQDRKIVYTGSIQSRTAEFDQDLQTVLDCCTQAGGYVESQIISGLPFTDADGTGRQASITLRIPKAEYGTAAEALKAIGQLVYSEEISTDITGSYTDTQIRLSNLNAQLDQLKQILAKSEKLEDVVTLVSEIGNVTTQIEQTESQLKLWDNQVEYTQISITLTEIQQYSAVEPTDPTLGTRITDAFYKSLSGIKSGALSAVVWLVGITPWLVALLAAAGIVILIAVPLRRRAIRRKAAPPTGK